MSLSKVTMLLSASTEVQTSAALQRAHSPHHSALLPQAAGRSARAPAGTAPVSPRSPALPRRPWVRGPPATGCRGTPSSRTEGKARLVNGQLVSWTAAQLWVKMHLSLTCRDLISLALGCGISTAWCAATLSATVGIQTAGRHGTAARLIRNRES